MSILNGMGLRMDPGDKPMFVEPFANSISYYKTIDLSFARSFVSKTVNKLHYLRGNFKIN